MTATGRARGRTVGARAAVACIASLAAAAGCAAHHPLPPPSPDPEYVRLTEAARTSFDQGLDRQAIVIYEQALTRARASDDATDIAEAEYGLAASLVHVGRYERAQGLLDDAAVELRRTGASPADVLLLGAKVARLRRDDAGATARAGAVLALPAARTTAAQRVGARLTRGQIACDGNDLAAASDALAAARREAGAAAISPSLRAGIDGLGGRIALASGRAGDAAPLFDSQADLLREAMLYREMSQALAAAGDAYRAAGQPEPAAHRYYRAARSTLAQGDAEEAQRLLALAQAQAEAAGEPAMLGRIRALSPEIPPSSQPAQAAP